MEVWQKPREASKVVASSESVASRSVEPTKPVPPAVTDGIPVSNHFQPFRYRPILRMRPTTSDRAVLQPPHDPAEGTRRFALTATSIALLVMTGCESLATIDRRTDERLRESAALVGEAGSTPRYDSSKYATGAAFPARSVDEDRPATVNPPVESLKVDRRDITSETAQAIIGRFNSMTEAPADATVLSFGEAMNFAQQHASEYLTAEETYIITALRLLIEEHRWGPTFFRERRQLRAIHDRPRPAQRLRRLPATSLRR